MSSELEKYKEIYKKFILQLVELHNNHQIFIHKCSEAKAFEIRKHFRSTYETLKELKKQSVRATDEARQLRKEKIRLRKEKKLLRQNSRKTNEQHNSTDQNTI